MKISLGAIQEHKDYTVNDKVEFDKISYQNDYIRDIKNVECEATYRMDDDYLSVTLKVKGQATLACAYSLEDVNKRINCSDTITFTDDKEKEDEDTIYFDKNEITLDNHILSLIIASLPSKVVKKGVELPQSGKGYRVLTEDEFIEERKNKKSSPFDTLADLDIDD